MTTVDDKLPKWCRKPPWDSGEYAVCVTMSSDVSGWHATLQATFFGKLSSAKIGDTPAGPKLMYYRPESTQVRVVRLPDDVTGDMFEYALAHARELWEHGDVESWTHSYDTADMGVSNPMMMVAGAFCPC